MSIGSLKIQTYMNNIANPVDKANIKVTLYDSNNIVKDVISLKTDDSGIAEINEIQTPPLELSLNENAEGTTFWNITTFSSNKNSSWKTNFSFSITSNNLLNLEVN